VTRSLRWFSFSRRSVTCMYTRTLPGWPDEFVKKSPKVLPTTFFCQNEWIPFSVKNLAQNLNYFCHFRNNYPKKAIAHLAKIRPIWSPWFANRILSHEKSLRQCQCWRMMHQTLELVLVGVLLVRWNFENVYVFKLCITFRCTYITYFLTFCVTGA
jgi:hypothetical protein